MDAEAAAPAAAAPAAAAPAAAAPAAAAPAAAPAASRAAARVLEAVAGAPNHARKRSAEALSCVPSFLQPIATHPCSWDPTTARVTLHVGLDACIVPDAEGRARVDQAQLVVVDDFIGEQERAELLDFITEPGWDPLQPPPASKWRCSTRDQPDAAPTWGLRGSWLRRLAESRLRAKLEVHSRLARMYPEYTIAHMPSEAIQMTGQGQAQGRHGRDGSAGEGGRAGAGSGADEEGGAANESADCMMFERVNAAPEVAGDSPGFGAPGGSARPRVQEGAGHGDDGSGDDDGDVDQVADAPIVDCNQFVANAAMYGDSYSWHVDADPSTLPYPSPWTLKFGHYVNREPGRPLFVSLLLYLNREWDRDWHADTIFLDTPSDCGVVVRPKPYRAVLLDQDIVHRLVPPSAAAGGRPRYSLVWKLVFVPRKPGCRVTLARKRHSVPAAFGSAVLMDRIVSRMAQARMKERGRAAAEGAEAAEAGKAAEGPHATAAATEAEVATGTITGAAEAALSWPADPTGQQAAPRRRVANPKGVVREERKAARQQAIAEAAATLAGRAEWLRGASEGGPEGAASGGRGGGGGGGGEGGGRDLGGGGSPEGRREGGQGDTGAAGAAAAGAAVGGPGAAGGGAGGPMGPNLKRRKTNSRRRAIKRFKQETAAAASATAPGGPEAPAAAGEAGGAAGEAAAAVLGAEEGYGGAAPPVSGPTAAGLNTEQPVAPSGAGTGLPSKRALKRLRRRQRLLQQRQDQQQLQQQQPMADAGDETMGAPEEGPEAPPPEAPSGARVSPAVSK